MGVLLHSGLHERVQQQFHDIVKINIDTGHKFEGGTRDSREFPAPKAKRRREPVAWSLLYEHTKEEAVGGHHPELNIMAQVDLMDLIVFQSQQLERWHIYFR